MSRRFVMAAAISAACLQVAPAAHAASAPFPHEFHHNMGYCAPFLAQLELPDGSPVRPFINHLIQDLTTDATFEGQKNLGDLYSDRARSETDQACVQRTP
jgi:hypothetical protein